MFQEGQMPTELTSEEMEAEIRVMVPVLAPGPLQTLLQTELGTVDKTRMLVTQQILSMWTTLERAFPKASSMPAPSPPQSNP